MSAGQAAGGVSVNATEHDPFRGFKFKVEIAGGTGAGSAGVAIGPIGFQSVTGMGEETEVVDYREGPDPVHMRKIPGLTSYPEITLSRGLTRSTALLDWRKLTGHFNTNGGFGDGVASSANPSFRREVTVQLFDKGDPFSNPVKTWVIHQAWCSALEVSDLDATSSDIVIETLTLVHEGWEMVGGRA